MTDQPISPPIPNDPPRIGEFRTLFGIRLHLNGTHWQKVITDGR